MHDNPGSYTESGVAAEQTLGDELVTIGMPTIQDMEGRVNGHGWIAGEPEDGIALFNFPLGQLDRLENTVEVRGKGLFGEEETVSLTVWKGNDAGFGGHAGFLR